MADSPAHPSLEEQDSETSPCLPCHSASSLVKVPVQSLEEVSVGASGMFVLPIFVFLGLYRQCGPLEAYRLSPGAFGLREHRRDDPEAEGRLWADHYLLSACRSCVVT